MAITGAVGSFLRRNDPYPDWSLVYDFTGLGPNNPGRPFYKNGNRTFQRFSDDPQLSFTRSGADHLVFNNVTNKWMCFSANIPSITSEGLYVGEGTTNKCTNYNAAPTDLTHVTKSGDAAATLTVVDDTAALRAAGFGDLIDAGKMSGMVYKLDNSAGSADVYAIFGGQTGNANAHTSSAFVRGGSGASSPAWSSGGAFSAAAAYRRVQHNAVPSDAANQMSIRADAGQVIYFILNQLEEKFYASNPVIVSGAAATRGNSQPVVTGLSSILTPPFTLVAVANLSAMDQTTRRLATAANATATDDFLIARGGSDEKGAFLIVQGVSQPGAATPVGSATGARLLKIAARLRNSTLSVAADGALTTPSTVSTVGFAPDRLFLGQNATLGAVLKSPLLFVGIAPDLTDAQLQYITQSSSMFTDFT